MPVLTPFNDNDSPCTIVHEYRINTKSRIIYLSIVLTVIIAFASLPFIEVPVIIESRGVIQGRIAYSNEKPKAYCYIKPSDIGKIKIGQPVSFQIDALSYKTWGLLSGRVTEISNDLILLNNDVAVFKVQCSMDKDHFELEGSRIYLKTGMSFIAMFKVGNLSLFDLSRHKPNRPIALSFYKQLDSGNGH
jgi:hypothetical protein